MHKSTDFIPIEMRAKLWKDNLKGASEDAF